MSETSLSLDAALVAEALLLGRALTARGWTVATAESCTGGLIACALTETGGSSHWFERAFVTYSNAAKVESIGVSQATLRSHGAVSEPVAREMAQGALRHSRARIALSVTGIAGPGGGTPDKPVGTVAFGWATAERIEVATRHFEGDRASIRHAAALFALRRAVDLVEQAEPAGRLA